MPKGKAYANRRHFKNRLEKRFGVSTTKQERASLSRQARDRSTYVRFVSSARSVHMVRFQGRSLLVLYDKVRSNIITVFPNRPKVSINGILITNPAYLPELSNQVSQAKPNESPYLNGHNNFIPEPIKNLAT